MNKSVQVQIAELEQAIAAQEHLRPALGDEVVDATITTLKEKLATLQLSFSEERKLVTCLFCDIVGSLRMAAERDPEDVLNIIDGALRQMSASVERFDGTVARYMGDGILSIFGAPKALEGHAERAILAGLDIQNRIREYAKQVERRYGVGEFNVRVGINSGYAIAGKIAGAKGEYTVIGDVVNVASRLEAAAPPGGVLVGEGTFRLAGGERAFEVQAWDPILVKGALEPLRVYQVLRPSRLRRHMIAPSLIRAPLTGREAELKALQDRFLSVMENGKPHITVVIGPAGIGKSRLKQEFAHWVSENYPSVHLWMGRTLSYEANTPYGLLGDLLRTGLDISEVEGVESRRAKLEEAWMKAENLTEEDLHSLAEILEIRYEENSLSGLEPQGRRNAIFKAFTRFFASQAELGDLLLVLEDTHWADDLSLEALEFLFGSIQEAPIFILMLTRPLTNPEAKALEIRARIPGDVYTEVNLNDLTLNETTQMVQSLLQNTELPNWLVSTIADRTQGNPFFIEEIINTLMEDGTLKLENGRWIVTREMADIHVPDTVQGVLAARIDRLEPDLKHVIQNAAMIGRTFWQQLLADLINEEVGEHLAVLANQDFIQQHGRATMMEDWEWVFRHVLVQEVAYNGVLKEVRRKIHCQIAQWLEDHGADRRKELSATLAFHYERGERWDKALAYLASAANRSRHLFALREAERFYDRAVRIAEKNPHEVDQKTLINLLESRGTVRGLAGHFEAAIRDLNQVLSATKAVGEPAREHELLVSLGMVYRRADDYEHAIILLNQALTVARKSGDQRSVADVLYHLGSVAWSEGDNVQATAYHQEAVEICRELALEDLVGVQALHGRGEAYWFSGLPNKAIEYLSESLELARKIGDKSYESENLQMIGFMHNPDYGIAVAEKSEQFANESLDISRKAHMDWHTIPALLTLGFSYIGSGKYQQALKVVTEANDQAEEVGSLRMLTIGLDHLGFLYQELNLWADAERTHARGVEVALGVKSNFWLPRLQANLCIDQLRQGDLGVGANLAKIYAEARERDQIAHMIRALEGLAELSMVKKEYQSSFDYIDELLKIAETGELRTVMARAYRWQGEAHAGLGEFEAARAHLQRALEITEQTGDLRVAWDVHAAMVKLYQAQKEMRLVERHEQAVREIIRKIAGNLKDPAMRRGLPGV